MRLRLLRLKGFRNLGEQLISFPANITLIVGANGQGKTSVLEAVYLLANAKSFRTSKIQELIKWQTLRENISPLGASVSAEVESVDGIKDIRCEISGNKKSIFLNDNKLTKARDFYGQLRCVVFTPDDLELVKGGPSARRKFIDSLLAMSNPGYVESLVSYQRALKNRNSLLSKFKRERVNDQEIIRKSLHPWETILVDTGLRVSAKRGELCQALSKSLSSYYSAMSKYQLNQDCDRTNLVNCRYQTQFSSDNGEFKQTEELFTEYQSRTPNDLRLQATSLGIHRDDLLLTILTTGGQKLARSFTSQGQARSLALALKLAAVDYLQASSEDQPILLLDDVESELDKQRSEAFYKILNQCKSQIIVTATEPSEVFNSALPGAAVMEIKNGVFSA